MKSELISDDSPSILQKHRVTNEDLKKARKEAVQDMLFERGLQ